jgi:hypothetical protein
MINDNSMADARNYDVGALMHALATTVARSRKNRIIIDILLLHYKFTLGLLKQGIMNRRSVEL